MRKTRVPKGEKYWYILLTYEGVEVNYKSELLSCFDDERFHNDNYFYTQAEAEACARKLRAILKGADVYTQEEITEIKANAFADGMEAERRKSKIVK